MKVVNDNLTQRKTAEDFEKAVKERNIETWIISSCTICDYPLGFLFRDNKVYFDHGCICTLRVPRLTNFEEVAQIYNMQGDKDTVTKMNEFWGFNGEEIND